MRYLGIFAKHWQPGYVKTRLAATIGDERAAHVHRACLQALLDRFQCTADRRILAFTPADKAHYFAQMTGDAWQLRPQAEGDLGARMHDFFTADYLQPEDHVVLIGSDSPNLPVSIVDEAFERLQSSSIVLGPSEDGGFYLIGARGSTAPCLDGIAWSTNIVWEQTESCLQSQGYQFEQLPRWFDVDEAEDLARLRGELAESAGTDRGLIRLRSALQEILER